MNHEGFVDEMFILRFVEKILMKTYFIVVCFASHNCSLFLRMSILMSLYKIPVVVLVFEELSRVFIC